MPLYKSLVEGITPLIGGTAGSILFLGANGVLSEDNAKLFYDDTNNRVGLGTTSPGAALDIQNPTGGLFVRLISGSAGVNLDHSRLNVSNLGGNFTFTLSGTSQSFVFSGGQAANEPVRIEGVTSATAPALVVEGGATPGAGGHLQSWRQDGGTEVARVEADGAIQTDAGITVGGALAVTGDCDFDGNVVMAAKYLEGAEMAAPAAPAADGFRLFAQDNGAGKTQLMVIFATGVAQQVAIEP